VDKVQDRGKFTMRKVNMKQFDREIEHVKRLYNSSWERNWGFVPMTEQEFDHLAEQLRPILDPDLVLVVEHEGQPVAFGLTVPDLNEPLLRAYPRPGTPEWLTMGKLLWQWKVRGGLKWLRVIALGVQSEFRGQGVDAMLYLQTARNAFPKGYQFAEMSWILESNDMMNRAIRLLGGEVYKTYRVYEKKL
jgi:GNAT superfamily N-acetyltransferase